MGQTLVCGHLPPPVPLPSLKDGPDGDTHPSMVPRTCVRTPTRICRGGGGLGGAGGGGSRGARPLARARLRTHAHIHGHSRRHSVAAAHPRSPRAAAAVWPRCCCVQGRATAAALVGRVAAPRTRPRTAATTTTTTTSSIMVSTAWPATASGQKAPSRRWPRPRGRSATTQPAARACGSRCGHHCVRTAHWLWGSGMLETQGRCVLLQSRLLRAVKAWVAEALSRCLHIDVRLVGSVAQLLASVAFIVLYIWSTYETPAPGSWRHVLDVGLALVFALEYVTRIKAGESGWCNVASLQPGAVIIGGIAGNVLLIPLDTPFLSTFRIIPSNPL